MAYDEEPTEGCEKLTLNERMSRVSTDIAFLTNIEVIFPGKLDEDGKQRVAEKLKELYEELDFYIAARKAAGMWTSLML